MQAFILEKITNDYRLKTALIANPVVAVMKFAEWIKQMPKKQDRQVAFRDANVTVANVVVPHMSIPVWALIKFPAGGSSPSMVFYNSELENSWRNKTLEDLKSTDLLGGFRAACFFNMQTLSVTEGFSKEQPESREEK